LRMYQLNWDNGWKAMVWVPRWLDTWILATEWYYTSWFTSAASTPPRRFFFWKASKNTPTSHNNDSHYLRVWRFSKIWRFCEC
jgi:hypothetical protein